MPGVRAPPENALMSKFSRLAGLGVVSPAFAVVGGMVDERTHLGFTNWRSACRASGFSIESLTWFTFQLLPTAVIGALAGGMLVLMLAIRSRHRRDFAGHCLAAHAGCAIAMPIGLVLCAMAIPIPLMLLAEVALAVAAAYLLQTRSQRKTATRFARHP
jgi:hypothetical protein